MLDFHQLVSMNFVRHPKSVRIRAIRVIRVPFFVLMNTISSTQTTTPITRHVLPKCGKTSGQGIAKRNFAEIRPAYHIHS
jgi:hypothetical protein